MSYPDSSLPDWAQPDPDRWSPQPQGTAQFFPPGVQGVAPTPQMPQIPAAASPLAAPTFRPMAQPGDGTFASWQPQGRFSSDYASSFTAPAVPTAPNSTAPPVQDQAATGKGALWAGLLGLLAGGLVGRGRGALAAGTGAAQGYTSGADQLQASRLQDWQNQNQLRQQDYQNQLRGFDAQMQGADFQRANFRDAQQGLWHDQAAQQDIDDQLARQGQIGQQNAFEQAQARAKAAESGFGIASKIQDPAALKAYLNLNPDVLAKYPTDQQGQPIVLNPKDDDATTTAANQRMEALRSEARQLMQQSADLSLTSAGRAKIAARMAQINAAGVGGIAMGPGDVNPFTPAEQQQAGIERARLGLEARSQDLERQRFNAEMGARSAKADPNTASYIRNQQERWNAADKEINDAGATLKQVVLKYPDATQRPAEVAKMVADTVAAAAAARQQKAAIETDLHRFDPVTAGAQPAPHHSATQPRDGAGKFQPGHIGKTSSGLTYTINP